MKPGQASRSRRAKKSSEVGENADRFCNEDGAEASVGSAPAGIENVETNGAGPERSRVTTRKADASGSDSVVKV